MTYERAAEILDPEHRETYESLEIVNEACRMGRAALFRRMPEPPHPDGDESILACPTCGSGEYLYNEDGNRCCFCGWCGQAIDWNAETFKAAGQMKPVLKYPGSKWRLAEWIVSLMPPHKSYLEPFFGSGAVFFKKPPSRIETINDLDDEELAVVIMCPHDGDEDSCKGSPDAQTCIKCCLEWLREPAEVL